MRKYSQKDGLRTYNPRKVLQDPFGFLWIATQDGLDRFDGRNFLSAQINSQLVKNVSGLDIHDLYYDVTRKLIWVLAGQGEILMIDPATSTVLKRIEISKDGSEDWANCFLVTHDKVWIGCLSGLKCLDIDSWKFLRISNAASRSFRGKNGVSQIREIVVDNHNNLWVLSSGSDIRVIDSGGKHVIKSFSFADDEPKKVFQIWDGLYQSNSIFVGTSNGLYRIIYDNDYGFKTSKSPGRESSYALASLSSNQILSCQSGLKVFDLNLVPVYSIESADSSVYEWLNSARSISMTRGPFFWVCSTQGILMFKLNGVPFKAITSGETTAEKLFHVYSVLRKKDKVYFLADNKIFELYKGKARKILEEDNLQYLIDGPGDNLLVSSATQTMRLSGNKLQPLVIRQGNSVVTGRVFNCAERINEDNYMLGTSNYQGVVTWNYKNSQGVISEILTAQQLNSKSVKSIYKGDDGGVWILAYNSISYKKAGSNFYQTLQYNRQTGKDFLLYFDIGEARNSYWIAVHQLGIVQLNKDKKFVRVLTTADGLSNNGVYQVFPVGDSCLYITSNNGLSIYNIDRNTFTNYYESDGLHSNAFEEASGSMKEGVIYAGGVDGFTIIDPSKIQINYAPPKVYVNRIVVDRIESRHLDTTNLNLNALNIPNDALQTTFYFSGINYSSPERTTFAYRIIEKSSDWINTGTQNFTNVFTLSPGKYHFELKAANEDGIWSEPISITLNFLPKWYQTLWFKGLLVFTAFGLGYGFYRLRINQILKQQQIRKDVAADLHDDIGSNLNSVKVFAHLAMSDPANKEYIRNVEENLEHATVGLRDMIWILNDQLDSVEDLCRRLDQLAASPAQAIGIAVHFTISDGLQHLKLSKPVKRNLFLIAKEAINNSVKYAACKNIWVTFRLVNKQLTMIIRDDGHGFNAASGSEGYGLNNMKSRAEQIRFNYELKSDPSGTEIRVAEK